MTTNAQPASAHAGHTAKPRAKLRLEIPMNLWDVALVDAVTCAAIGGMGVSWR